MPRDTRVVAELCSLRSRGAFRSLVRRSISRVSAGRSVITILETAASLIAILAAKAVDPSWYAVQRRRESPRMAARMRAAMHYVAFGRRGGLSPHPLAEPEWCDPQHWRSRGPDPVARILVGHGWHRRRGPHPLVDLSVWTRDHPEAARHRRGPFGHLLANLADETPMPVPPWWGSASAPSYREFRARAMAALGPVVSAVEPPSGEVLVVVESREDGWERPQRAVLCALGEPAAAVTLVLVAPRRPAARRIIWQLGLHPRVATVDGTATAVLGDEGRRLAVLLHERAEGWPGWLAQVTAPLDRQVSAADASAAGVPIVACGPLALAADGSLAEAGRAARLDRDLPLPLLAGLPPSDAQRCGELLQVLGVSAAALAGYSDRLLSALTAREVASGPQTDALAAGAWWATDLCLRLVVNGGRCVTVTTALAWWPDGPPVDDAASRRIVAAMLADVPGGQLSPAGVEDGLLEAAGLTAQARFPDVAAGGSASVHMPVFLRAERSGDASDRLRWSIRMAAPAGPRATAWGDWHFAHALAAALERLGQRAAVDCHEARHRATAYLDDVVVVLRGRDAWERLPGQVVLLWVISHPELVDEAELGAADAVFAASMRWSRVTSHRTGHIVTPLLQATDPATFHPDAEPPARAEDVLFVGNTRGIFRPAVRHLVESGIDVAIYGRGWERFVDRRLIKGDSIPNDSLAGHYRAAGVVLNDHWDHMREQGFLSNRLFDAAASGACVVSDEVEGSRKLFGGLVRTFGSRGELLALVEGAHDAFPNDANRASLARGIGREHSFDARAATLLSAAVEARARRQRGAGVLAEGTP